MTVMLKSGDFGTWVLVAEDGRDILFQTDWDFPYLASNFGFVAYGCGATDGTVDCPHKTASEVIAAAAEFLEHHEGEAVEDPGYFGD